MRVARKMEWGNANNLIIEIKGLLLSANWKRSVGEGKGPRHAYASSGHYMYLSVSESRVELLQNRVILFLLRIYLYKQDGCP